MAGATKAITAVNSAVDPKTVMQTMNNFTKEVDRMAVAEEMWDDMVDLFDGDGVQEGADDVVNSVLDELGINLGAQMADAPTHSVFSGIPGLEQEAAASASTSASASASSARAAPLV